MVKKVTINDTPLVNVVVDKPVKKPVKKQTRKEVKEVKNEIQDEMNDEEINTNESDLDSDSDDEIGKYEHRSNHGIYLFFQFIKKNLYGRNRSCTSSNRKAYERYARNE